jgi:hypothetical protein
MEFAGAYSAQPCKIQLPNQSQPFTIASGEHLAFNNLPPPIATYPQTGFYKAGLSRQALQWQQHHGEVGDMPPRQFEYNGPE